jgi:glycerol-3-phosphate dehydrogenase
MSTGPAAEVEVAVVGAGVVGCAVGLALSRRGIAVAILEAEPEPALAASATNSGILHTGFDSKPGELETELILRSAALRPPLLETLNIPLHRCGAVVRGRGGADRPAIEKLAANAARNGVEAVLDDEGTLSVPGEAVTDPVAFTLALSDAARKHGAAVLTGRRVVAIAQRPERLTLEAASGERLTTRLAVNCAGLYADTVARLAGDDSFTIYPRKGEFLVFAAPPGQALDHILLPVPSARTKGVLVFPTLDGMVVAGPTAVDLEDKEDWSVRPEAREAIVPQASATYPPLADAEPVFAYAGLRPAGRGVNYLIERSRSCPPLVHVAAIRSTGLTASLGIAEHVTAIVASAGVALAPEQPLKPGSAETHTGPWWRRTAEYRVPKAA